MKDLGLTDAPLTTLTGELLGVRAHIEALVQFICQCNTPMTIAIQGDWGTGKTSMMNIVRTQLKNRGITCVWFNTWQFSQFNMQEDVPVALLMELLRSLGIEQSKVKEIAVNFFKRTAVVAATVFGGKEAGDATKESLAVSPMDIFAQIRELREKLEKDIQEKLKNSGSDRIVIFVDDLDRMNPGRAVELLEVIKNFMDLPGCVFVLAVDYGVVINGARQKYGEGMDEAKSRSFFDKIIQLPFNLPVSQYNITKYLKNIFDIPDGDLGLYKELATNSVGTNPRSLKRLANVMNLLKLLAAQNYRESLEKPEFQRVLFAILCLQMAYEPIYSAIMSSDNIEEMVDRTPEELADRFETSLEKCPGKKEEVGERFKYFMQALQAGMPKKANSEDEIDADLFIDLLGMSGLTASGGMTLINSNAVKNSFDPALVARMPSLCDEISNKFPTLWDMLSNMPIFRMRDTRFILPLTFGTIVTLDFGLGKDGIYISCYSEQKANIVKKPFYNSFKQMAPKLDKDVNYSGRAFTFLSFPFIPWKVPVSDMSDAASQARAKQVDEVIVKTWCEQLLPPMTKIWAENDKVLTRLQEFLVRIEKPLKDIFPSQKGWQVQIGKKGKGFLEGNDLITVKKSTWQFSRKIMLSQDGGGQFVALYQRWDEKWKDNPETISIFEHWKEQSQIGDERLAGRDHTYAFWAYLPEPVRNNWTTGQYFFPDFQYGLDQEKETHIMEVLMNYFRAFAALEEELDAWATSDPELG